MIAHEGVARGHLLALGRPDWAQEVSTAFDEMQTKYGRTANDY